VGDLLLQRALPVDRLVVAIDPGKVQHRVWLTTDAGGLVEAPLTLPVVRGHVKVPAGGHEKSPRVASGSPHLAFVVSAGS